MTSTDFNVISIQIYEVDGRLDNFTPIYLTQSLYDPFTWIYIIFGIISLIIGVLYVIFYFMGNRERKDPRAEGKVRCPTCGDWNSRHRTECKLCGMDMNPDLEKPGV